MYNPDPSDFGLKEDSFTTEKNEIKRHRVSKEYSKQLAFSQKKMYQFVHQQTSRNPSLFLTVPEIIDSFFQQENVLWQRTVQLPFPFEDTPILDVESASTSRTLHSPLPFENDGTEESLRNSIGRAFLEHAESCNQIHQYFLKLDPRRCCVHARVIDDDTTIQPGPLRRVKSGNIPNDSVKNGSTRGSQRAQRPFSPRGQKVIFVYKLSLNEEKIYKQVLQCALQPVLTCPLHEPSPITPSTISSPDGRTKRLTFSPSQKRPQTESFIEATAIEPQSLIRAIMHAFQINQTYHFQLKKELMKSMPNRGDTARSLAQDLAEQLYRLQANNCIFYRIDQFETQDYYEEWRSKQIEFVENLMNKWCPGYADINAMKCDPFDAHKALITVVNKFVRHDLEEKNHTAARDTRENLSSLLTTTSMKIIKEFCLRFGICKLYQSIIILSTMVDHLDYTDWYLSCLERTLLETMDYIHNNEKFLVKAEKSLIKECIQRLHHKIEYGFVKIYTLYPRNVTEEGVRLLLILLRSVIETKDNFDYWEIEDVPSISKMISQYIKIAVIESYNILKDKAELESALNKNKYEDCISADTLGIILQDIRKNVNLISELCANCPLLKQSCEDIILTVAQNFYSLFMTDIKTLCYTHTSTIRTSEVDYHMIGLSFRLGKLDEDWNGLIPPLKQKWRVYYKVVLTVAILAVKEYIIKNIPSYITLDTRKMLSLADVIPDPAISAANSPPQPPQPFSMTSYPPVGSKVLDRKGSSAFVAVRSIRNELRKGSCVSIEANLKKEWRSQISLESSVDEICSDEDVTSMTSRTSSISSSHRYKDDTRSLSEATSDGLDEIDRDKKSLSESTGQDEVDLNNNDDTVKVDNVESRDTPVPRDLALSSPTTSSVTSKNNIDVDVLENDQQLEQNKVEDDGDNEEDNDGDNNKDDDDGDIIEVVKDVLEELFEKVESSVAQTTPTLDECLQQAENEDDENDYRVSTVKLMAVQPIVRQLSKDFDNNPTNQGVVRKKIPQSAPHETETIIQENESYEEEELLVDSSNATFAIKPMLHHVRPSSQPVPSVKRYGYGRGNRTLAPSDYSIYGPHHTSPYLKKSPQKKPTNHDDYIHGMSKPVQKFDTLVSAAVISCPVAVREQVQSQQIDEISAASFESASSLTLHESKQLSKEFEQKYQNTLRKKQDESLKPKRLRNPRGSLQLEKKPNLPKVHRKFSKSLSNLIEIGEPGKSVENMNPERKPGLKENNGTCGNLTKDGFLLTTSSLTDILIVCSRLISFSVEVCSLVTPSTDNQQKHEANRFNFCKSKVKAFSSQTDQLDNQRRDNKMVGEATCQQDEQELKQRYIDTRANTLSKILDSMKGILTAYASSLLSLDMCGTKIYANDDVFTENDLKFLKDIHVRHEELIPGCRHCFTLGATPEGISDPLRKPCELLERLYIESFGGWELITEEMCFRINNIFSLLHVLPELQRKAAKSLQVDLEPLLHECDEKKESSVKYSYKGPCDQTGTYPTYSLLCFELRPVQDLLENILQFQVKLLTCRSMTIFTRLFDVYYSLPFCHRLPAEHMATCTEHLMKQMSFFRYTMYSGCVQMVTIEIWKAIVKKYHELVNDVYLGNDDPCAKGKKLLDLLVNTRKCLMTDISLEKQFYDIMVGVLSVTFSRKKKPVLFRLELFDLPCSKLSMIFRETMEDRVHEIYNNVSEDYTYEELIYMLRSDLRRSGKPNFTGEALLDVLRNHKTYIDRFAIILKIDPKLYGSFDAKAMYIAKYLLRQQIVRPCGEINTNNFSPVKSRGVVMASPPCDPISSFKAPARLLDQGLTIDVLDNSNSVDDESYTEEENSRSNTMSPMENNFQECGILYTFRSEFGLYNDAEYKGKLHSAIRVSGKKMNERIQHDIVDIFRYKFCFDRTTEVCDFFTDFALQRPRVRRFSCSW